MSKSAIAPVVAGLFFPRSKVLGLDVDYDYSPTAWKKVTYAGSQAVSFPQGSRDLKELADYERKVIYPLASERREIDLDDGVKHNYPLFGEALKKIAGMEAKEDE